MKDWKYPFTQEQISAVYKKISTDVYKKKRWAIKKDWRYPFTQEQIIEADSCIIDRLSRMNVWNNDKNIREDQQTFPCEFSPISSTSG
jgi:hypothetical protein